MRIVTLNTWGGQAGSDKLLSFFKEHSGSIDVFCLQEIWSDKYQDFEGKLAGGRPIDHGRTMTHGLQEITNILGGHVGYFRPHFLENYGLCTFVRKEQKVLEEGEIFVHKHKGYDPPDDIGRHARNVQFITLETEHGPLTIMNFHGLWNGQGKGDSDERIQQSEKILEFIKQVKNPFVLTGDFNLVPDAESLLMLERAGMRNLVREYGITSTRTSLYTKPERYADYVLVSEGVNVADFKVLPDEVSDHSPLLVEIE